MTCAHAGDWLQLYLDGRLDARHLAPLERHLAECPGCRQDLVLLETMRAALEAPEPLCDAPDLAPRICARVAALEEARLTARAAPATRRADVRWIGPVLLAVGLVIYLLLPPALAHPLRDALTSALASFVQTMVAPGPDSVAWAAWVGGLALLLALALRYLRAESSAALRRALAARLPQLW